MSAERDCAKLTEQDLIDYFEEFEDDSILNDIYDVIGPEALLKLMEAFGGTVIYVSAGSTVAARIRPQKIFDYYVKSKNIRETARVFGVDMAVVYKITKEYRKSLKGRK